MPQPPPRSLARRTQSSGFATPRAWSAAASFGVHAAALACAGWLAFGSGAGENAAGFRGAIAYAPLTAPPEFAIEREPAPAIELSEVDEPVLVECAVVERDPVREPAPPLVAVSELDARLAIDRTLARMRDTRPRGAPIAARTSSGAEVAPSASVAIASAPPDTSAEPVDTPAPDYPRMAVRLGEEGAVLLRITVAADGSVRSVAVVESSGSPRLDDAAVECVRAWRYRAATRAGVAFESELLHRVTFELERAL